MSETRTEIIADATYVAGKLEGKDIVLFLSGVSEVNAAMTTQGAIDHFKITHIVFSGIAGGTNPSLSAGMSSWPIVGLNTSRSVFARKTADGWSVPKWLGTTLPNYGMIFPYTIEIAHPGQTEPEKRFWFDVDPIMLETARSVATKVELKPCLKRDVCKVTHHVSSSEAPAFPALPSLTMPASASGYKTFKANSVDNESAPVAHVAYANHIPFIAFRGLSDLAGGDAGENTEKELEHLASNNAATVAKAFLSALPAQQPSERSPGTTRK